jgi:hypothetical protein
MGQMITTSDQHAAVSPSRGADCVKITTEDDPTPLVMFIARTLREAHRHPELAELSAGLSGSFALRSVQDPQAATLTFGESGVHVAHGADAGADHHSGLDIAAPLGLAGDELDPALTALQQLLQPPLAPWQDLARSFWDLTSGDPGMPARLDVTCSDNAAETLVFGSGEPRYAISGGSAQLQRIFFGTDDILSAAYAGAIGIEGTLPQLSVMTGASWKVRFEGGR